MSRPLILLFGIVLFLVLFGAYSLPSAVTSQRSPAPNDVLILLLDGLRPDYIVPEVMPNLHAFGQGGVIALQHHVMFPTVTRVNASTIGTGTFPGTHGLLHNEVHLPGKSTDNFNTADVADIGQMRELTDNRVLTTPTLGDLLDRHGMSMIAIGSGSYGSTALLNATSAGRGVLNSRGHAHPESLWERVVEALGEPPARTQPNTGHDRWTVEAYRHLVLSAADRPQLTMMWLNEPDAIQHGTGVGTPETLRALSYADENFGRILAMIEAEGLRDHTNIFIATDHGFSTHTGGFNVRATLTEHGLDERIHIAAGSQLYVRDRDPRIIEEAVRSLQSDPAVGPIFTAPGEPGDALGWVPGTLSTDLIRWTHRRSSDILVTPNWSSDLNTHGYRGTTTAGGTAGHSTLSPHEMQVHLIAGGPDIKAGGLRSHVPTGNVDLAPTVIHLLGLDLPETMEGRVLHELLAGGPGFSEVEVQSRIYQATAEGATGKGSFSYDLTLHLAQVQGVPYFTQAVVQRSHSPYP